MVLTKLVSTGLTLASHVRNRCEYSDVPAVSSSDMLANAKCWFVWGCFMIILGIGASSYRRHVIYIYRTAYTYIAGSQLTPQPQPLPFACGLSRMANWLPMSSVT